MRTGKSQLSLLLHSTNQGLRSSSASSSDNKQRLWKWTVKTLDEKKERKKKKKKPDSNSITWTTPPLLGPINTESITKVWAWSEQTLWTQIMAFYTDDVSYSDVSGKYQYKKKKKNNNTKTS